MESLRSILSTIHIPLMWMLTASFSSPLLQAQSPVSAEDYVMPEELATLQQQYSSIPDCMYEYEVNLYPPLDGVVHKFHYRFMTVRGMWRYERVDENGLMFYKLCFDGKVFHQFFKESDIGRIRPMNPNPRYHHARFTGGNMIVVIPNPLPDAYKDLATTEFAWNPLFAPVDMPFLARPKTFKTPDLHAATLWEDVMRRSATRHRTGKETPANQAHFLLDDEALNGILKLEKITPEPHAWRVLEHDYITRAGSMHITTKYEDWRKFTLDEKEGTVLEMPVLTTITAKGIPQSSVTTLQLLPDTVAKPAIGLTIEDFRIPDTISNPPAQVVDLTVPPAEKNIATKSKSTPSVKPSTSPPAKPAQKPKLGGAELKPPPKLKPAPKL